MIDGYYNRFDQSKEYESHLFRAGFVLQSAELNEIQYSALARVRGIGDALFSDGDVVRDARLIVNPTTGETTCESGAIYLNGAVRGVQSATLTVPVTGVVTVGIYLQSTVVTELEDPSLRDPASLTRNYMEPGAARHKLHTAWGFSGDGQTGEFYPVYTVEDGYLRAKEAPPNLNALSQALARYDRDSAGGTYVVSGLSVQRTDDLVSGEQVYTISEGSARVNGYGVDQTTSRRLVYPAVPDLREISSEPHVSATASAQRINTDRAPINDIVDVTITQQKTVNVTHGGFVGAQDPLPDTSILSLVSVSQGGTTYVQGTDYKLTAGKVDWSLAGAEPATGSTYSVTYQYLDSVTPTDVDDTGFTVTGAVVGSLVLVSYNQKLPRFDRLAITSDGEFVWIQGVAADWNPQMPTVPPDMLALAHVYQAWGDATYVVNDGVRVVPMQDLARINNRLDFLAGLIAQQRLESSANLKEATQKKGIFVDPFINDTLRDAGATQTAAIFGGELTLPISVAAVSAMSADVTAPNSMTYSMTAVLSQPLRTGNMKVNPYQAFDPIPATATLTPAVDRWNETNDVYNSTSTGTFITGIQGLYQPPTTGIMGIQGLAQWQVTSNYYLASTTTQDLPFLRAINVRFRLEGLTAGEEISTVLFDGVSVPFVAA